ncbi:MAG: thioredoxin-disulfide reductase [Alphaproteobacteria bacterium]
MSEYKSDLLIIGSGPAGYTAGIYAARAGIRSLLVSGAQKGGQLIMSSEVENFPGFADPITGYDLMDRIRQQAQKIGVHVIDDVITEVDFFDAPFVCNSEAGNCYTSRAIIIATGASVKWLGLPSEQKYIGHGVSSCATCDGFFFAGKEVAVVGGGNSAVEEALYLSNFVEKVYLIHRRHALNAEHIMQKRLFENRKIIIMWNNIIEEVLGNDEPLEVTGLRIRNVKTDRVQKLAVSGLFVAIGHHPNTELFRRYLRLDGGGYIATNGACGETDIKGVYAAGDVCNPYRQAIIAAGCGARSAMEAIKYL